MLWLARAAQAKVANAKDLKQYRKETDTPRMGNLSARERPVGKHKPLIPSDVIPGFSYGRKVRPSTPIQEVISARFADKAERELSNFYAEMREAREANRGHVRKITTTAATRMQAEAVKKALTIEMNTTEPFKLSRFKNVSAKVTSYRDRPMTAGEDAVSEVFSERLMTPMA
ncbi:unnamed protein product [Polarella glacialis]|uniref:Uncharacterized protein n=1 Tax=Polarella glacialis TaxID=89957 RepID=A0A813EQY2_POLGL|nr:unnamed protein product [Polarella glacialis]